MSTFTSASTYNKSSLFSFPACPPSVLPPATKPFLLSPNFLYSNHDQHRSCTDGCTKPQAANQNPGPAPCHQGLGCDWPADSQVPLQGEEGDVEDGAEGAALWEEHWQFTGKVS